MFSYRRFAWAIFAMAGLNSVAAADEFADPGRRIFQRHCQTCHGGTGQADSPIGPDLTGIIGRKAGAGDSGVHSRLAVESGIVWTRSSLRRYLQDPGREMPGTLMPVQVSDPRELDDLLNYLESLR
ncbi:MAG TPA: c-type cytochrome [Burkholderiales bacterium]|nr:c-type cytochrome [Burkholderiales bacterium]